MSDLADLTACGVQNVVVCLGSSPVLSGLIALSTQGARLPAMLLQQQRQGGPGLLQMQRPPLMEEVCSQGMQDMRRGSWDDTGI